MKPGDDYEQFCTASWPRLVSGLAHYFGDRQLAEDAAQEALIRAGVSLTRVGALASPLGWTLEVDEWLGQPSPSAVVEVGLSLPGSANVDEVLDGLTSLSKVIVVLSQPGLYDAAPELYGVRNDGEYLGLVNDTGEISFPGMDPDTSQALTRDHSTVPSLRSDAATPPVIIEVVGTAFRRTGRVVPLAQWERGP